MHIKKRIVAGAIIATLGTTAVLWAQSNSGSMTHTTDMDHNAVMDHGAEMDANTTGVPVNEPGQGAFGAIAEIVAQLEADPNTNWNEVDIDGLREHLRDMDLVSIDAKVAAQDVAGGMEYTVTGNGDVVASIQRMAMAHSSVMGGTNGWQFSASEIETGALVTVIVPEPDLAKLKALGFFGILASGSHHQAHHWMLASGQDPHG